MPKSVVIVAAPHTDPISFLTLAFWLLFHLAISRQHRSILNSIAHGNNSEIYRRLILYYFITPPSHSSSPSGCYYLYKPYYLWILRRNLSSFFASSSRKHSFPRSRRLIIQSPSGPSSPPSSPPTISMLANYNCMLTPSPAPISFKKRLSPRNAKITNQSILWASILLRHSAANAIN